MAAEDPQRRLSRSYMKLNSAVQESLISLLLHDESADGGKAVRALIPPKLYDPFFKNLAEAAHHYWEQYKKAPGEHTLDLINTLKEREPDSASIYDRIFTSIEDNKSRINKKYILDQANQFARLQRIKSTTAQTLQVLKRAENGDKAALDEAEAMMQRVGKDSIDIQDCGLLLNDPEQALSFLADDEERSTFRTGIKELDKYDLGPTRKKYHLTVAPTGTGKSWAAMQWGRMGLIDGAKVLHVTCEMTAQEVAQRYVQSICSVRKRDSETIARYLLTDEKGRFDGLDEAVLKRPSLKDENIRGVLLKALKPLARKPQLYIKEFSSGKATVKALESYLDNMEATRNIVFDMMLVDYPDLFDHDPKHKRVELEKITVDLRGIAGERNMAVAGFSQANEKSGGGKQGVVSTGRAAEGRAKEHTADIILTLNQTAAEYELGLMRVFVAKARGDVKGFQVLISQALNAGQFVLSSALMNKSRYWSEVGTEEGDVNEGEDDND